MSSIFGFKGNFSLDTLVNILNTRDASVGLYLENEEYSTLDIYSNLDSINLSDKFNFAFASISNNLQPYVLDDLVLVFDGCIYNKENINKYLSSNFSSSHVLLLNLIKHELKTKGIVDAISFVMDFINGDYSFALLYKGEVLLGRDFIGVKPLFYSNSNENLVFSSQYKMLKTNGFSNIKSLSPGCFYYKGEEFNVIDVFSNIVKFNTSYDTLVKDLANILYNSVYERVKDLDSVGVLISGGVDSAFITYILNDISKSTGLDIYLYAVGNKDSKDLFYSKKIANDIHKPLKICEVTYDLIKYHINDVVNAIGSTNLMKLGVGTTIFLATKMMMEDNLKVGLSGQGADELFAGYNRYIKHIENNKREKLEEELIKNLKTMDTVNLERDYNASTINNIELRLPYLSRDLINFGLKIPTEYKIKNKKDTLKKHILRDAALKYGVPEEIAKRPKKAAQYGSGIDKILKKKIRKEINIEELLKY